MSDTKSNVDEIWAAFGVLFGDLFLLDTDPDRADRVAQLKKLVKERTQMEAELAELVRKAEARTKFEAADLEVARLISLEQERILDLTGALFHMDDPGVRPGDATPKIGKVEVVIDTADPDPDRLFLAFTNKLRASARQMRADARPPMPVCKIPPMSRTFVQWMDYDREVFEWGDRMDEVITEMAANLDAAKATIADLTAETRQAEAPPVAPIITLDRTTAERRDIWEKYAGELRTWGYELRRILTEMRIQQAAERKARAEETDT